MERVQRKEYRRPPARARAALTRNGCASQRKTACEQHHLQPCIQRRADVDVPYTLSQLQKPIQKERMQQRMMCCERNFRIHDLGQLVPDIIIVKTRIAGNQ